VTGLGARSNGTPVTIRALLTKCMAFFRVRRPFDLPKTGTRREGLAEALHDFRLTPG